MRIAGTSLAALVFGSVLQAGDQPVLVTPVIPKNGTDVVHYLVTLPTKSVGVTETDVFVRAETSVINTPLAAQTRATPSKPSGQTAIAGASISQRQSSALYARLLEEAAARGLK